MKVTDSGMPGELTWRKFFDIPLILQEMQIHEGIYDLAEMGTGYGTFTLPVAVIISGNLFGFDIEEAMVLHVQQKIPAQRRRNIFIQQRDILEQGTGLPDESVDYVMLFNLLHHHQPLDFLHEAHRILRPGGKTGIIHWRSDIPTPRGPDVGTRPRPQQITQWAARCGLSVAKIPFVLPPWHMGAILQK